MPVPHHNLPPDVARNLFAIPQRPPAQKLPEPAVVPAEPPKWLTAERAEKAKKYTIIDPLTVNAVEKDAFLQSLAGEYIVEGPSIAQAIYKGTIKRPDNVPSQLWMEVVTLASYYTALSNTNARLPNFGRWVCGLYPKRPEFVEAFAKVGQATTTDTYTLSVDPIDFLRCGDTPHFYSCLKREGGFDRDVKRLVEEAAGLTIVYTDDAEGKIKRRMWLMHVKNPDNQDAVVVYGSYGGANARRFGKVLSDTKKIPVYEYNYWDNQKSVELTVVNGLPKHDVHFDIQVSGIVKGVLIQ